MSIGEKAARSPRLPPNVQKMTGSLHLSFAFTGQIR
jgi:hypothetical protein